MLDFLDWRGMGCEWKPLLIFPQLRRPGAEEEEEAEEENNNYNNVEKKVLEMPARRSNYVPLSQLAEPPENPLQEPQQHYPGRHNNLSLPERLAYDHQKWYQFPYPEWSPGGGGVGGGRGFCPSNGLQRQSSGSSFADSSLSSDYPLPTLSPTVSLNASDSAFFNALYDDGWKQNNNEGRLNNNNKLGDGAGKNWAQQTEESYHLQLALALRLSAEATLTEDPHLLAPHCNEPRPGSSGSARNRAQAMSHRFWVNGCLSYYDKVPDGFYQIWGMNPYVWTMCNDVGESGRMPSMESLKGVDASDTSLEVILIDKCADSHLRELENKALGLAHGYSSTKELIEQLGKLVCMLMGGAASTEHGDLMMRWKVSSKMLRDCLNCIVLPIGSLSVGLCRHRALLFKVLADTIDLPCRIARGCKYCGLDDGSSCIVQYGVDRCAK